MRETDTSRLLIYCPSVCQDKARTGNSLGVSCMGGTEEIEPLPAVSQGAHWQEAKVRSGAGTRIREAGVSRDNQPGSQMLTAVHCPTKIFPTILLVEHLLPH